MIDLSTLPAPNVVLPLDYEATLAALKTRLADSMRAYVPAIDAVLALESDPLVQDLELLALEKMAFTAVVNDAARDHLLAFATGSGLDHLAALFGVTRQPGEPDTRLRLRLQNRIAALASQGTREYYEYQALTASANVRAVQATSPTPGSVLVLLWCVDQTQADATRLAVNAVLNSDSGRMLGVNLNVVVAQPQAINITANIYRERQAPADLVALLNTRLQAAFAGMSNLGAAIARSYITTLLHVDGVARVEYQDSTAPADLTAIGAGNFPTLGRVLLVDMGVA
ncbi:baseplate J/gp47 family protein [Comamonas sp. J-3]|uniref:baseplate J/gp47 family protein n=1 Tax=Comamonas trifloxystrobinivorans TaxID=3350256 RepID=UPI0037278CBB